MKITFKYNMPLSQTMIFEEIYPEELQMDVEEKQNLRDVKGSVFVWLFIDDEIAGEAYGVPPKNLDEDIEGLTDKSDFAMYCYSNTVLPKFQKQGIGSILKTHWLGLVAGKGFKTVYGHARPGGSQELNAKFGVRFIQDFENWYDTGETYKMYELDLATTL